MVPLTARQRRVKYACYTVNLSMSIVTALPGCEGNHGMTSFEMGERDGQDVRYALPRDGRITGNPSGNR